MNDSKGKAYSFYTADVFTDRIFGGNQLAVFPEAAGLSDRQMQSIAKEFNLSETVFVFPPESPANTKRLRIFTPGEEVPFAGHPTVGTGHILASIGAVETREGKNRVIFEENVGPVPVDILMQEGSPVFCTLTAAKLPERGPEPPSASVIASVLSLDDSDLLSGQDQPETFSCGLPFLFVPVRDRAALNRISLNQHLWTSHLRDAWANAVFVFCYDPELPGSDIRARMFAPGFGIAEDSATGSAASALAGYLAARDSRQVGLLQWVIEQGFEMGRPSLLFLEAEKERGRLVEVRVGGSSVLVSQGTLTVPAGFPTD
jgi:trans-2,3-dihydro-3-hydroxyanthranilate isomerase